MPDAPDLLRDWLTDAQADEACAEYGLSRLIDFEWNGSHKLPLYRVRPDARNAVLAKRSAPSLFD